jgi:S-DNA-T family DNA segregation ATPase FtsK/SpoIIIE
MVDAPNAPIERATPAIPPAPTPLHPAPPAIDPASPESLVERTLFDRLAGGFRVEPILGRLRAAVPPVAPGVAPAPPPETPTEVVRFATTPTTSEEEIEAEEGEDNPFAPDSPTAEQAAASAAPGVKIVPRKSTAAQGKRAARAGQREHDLGSGEYELPPLDILSLPPRASAETKIDESALEQNARLLETVLEDFGVKGQIVKVRPGPVVTLYELEPAPGTKSSRVIG